MPKSTSLNQQNAHHCPVKGCLYAVGSERFFTNKRLLNQHKAKVHAEKKYTCSKCQKGFGIDWLKKYHELTCGKSWTCSCGQSYCSRESLLSHVRRKDHHLSEDMKLPPRRMPSKPPKTKRQEAPPVVFIVPVYHPVTVVLPSALPKNNSSSRKILPKQTPTLISTISTIPTLAPLENNASSDNFVLQAKAFSNSNQVGLSHSDLPVKLRPTKTIKDSMGKLERKLKGRPKTVAETQTCDELQLAKSLRKLESRGSQCYGQVMKQGVGIESTHTQTMESTIVKIKKKTSAPRSRQKSVAVITDSNLSAPTQTLWSEFEQFLLSSKQEKDPLKVNCTSSTQTALNSYSDSSSKVMCDSQTLTDGNLFPFDINLITEDSQLKITTDIIPNRSEAMLLNENSKDGNIPRSESNKDLNNLFDSFDLWNNNKAEDTRTQQESLFTSILDGISSSKQTATDSVQYSSEEIDESLDLNSMFSTIMEKEENDERVSPLFLNTQTQTNSPLRIDYSTLLANMETQTTDDFEFPDLEFSDIETQTLWEGITNLVNDAAQFSIESQTDFSSLYTLNRPVSAENMSPVGKHMETQTLDQLPELTNSEAQTLIASSYLFA